LYTADIIAHDLEKVDACVLRLKTKFEAPVVANGIKLPIQPETFPPLSSQRMVNEGLSHLSLTNDFEIESTVRVLGYNQSGEGLIPQGESVDNSPCFEIGHVSKKIAPRGASVGNSISPDFERGLDVSKQIAESRSRHQVFLPQSEIPMQKHGHPGEPCFSPQSEIVIKCHTKPGHSGGPCVNENGQVIGIVSRVDPIEESRCYLAPAKLIANLLKKAKDKIKHPNGRTQKVRWNELKAER